MLLENLKIVAISNLLEYENFDPIRTKRLIAKIPKDTIFTNPVILAKIPRSTKLVLIDGANRVEAMKKLGYKNVLAQTVNYLDENEVKLYGNRHWLNMNGENFIQNLQTKIRLTKISQNILKENAEQKLIGWIKIDEEKYFSLGKHKGLIQTVFLLNKLVEQYIEKIEIYRQSEFKQIEKKYPVEIVFHRFTPQDIIRLIRQTDRLHSGITRHVASYYYLRVNLPLIILKYPTESANKKLKQIIHQKTKQKKIRFCPSPVYLFDEWRKEY